MRINIVVVSIHTLNINIHRKNTNIFSFHTHKMVVIIPEYHDNAMQDDIAEKMF